MKPSQLRNWLKIGVDDPLNTPPSLVEGPPGIGKSRIHWQVTVEMKTGFCDFRAAQRDPSDVRGFPMLAKSIVGTNSDGTPIWGDTARWIPPDELPNIARHGTRGIMVVDEITSCAPLMQASLYQLILDRKIGEYTLPDGWYISACGNRLEDRAVVFKMSSALANRFVHIKLEHNVEDWIKWALDRGDIDPTIVAFIKFRPELLFKFNAESNEKAFATPRTWEYCDAIIKKLGPGAGILNELLEGTVGQGVAAEFMAFMKIQKELPDLSAILNGSSDFFPIAKRMDLRYAMIAGLVGHAKNSHCERLLNYSENIPEEFAVLLVTMLVQKLETALVTAPSWKKWALKHSDVIVARGS